MSMLYTVHESSVIDQPCLIGEGTMIWHFCHIMEGARIGANCNLGQNVMVGKGAVLGNNNKVQNNVTIYAGVTCEDDVFLGPSMVFTNVINPRSAVDRKHEFKQTLVKKGSSIGANATILCGITIGAYAMIGAGAVVTRDVKPYALVTGNPARQRGWVSEFGTKLDFSAAGEAFCPGSGSMYRLQDDEVSRVA